MFESFEMAPPDAILGLAEAFRQDPNPDKINLTVGVYKNAQGETPVLRSVKQAERSLVESEETKGYLPIDGLPQFGMCVRELLFGRGHEIIESDRSVTLQTPGGTGALRVAADLLKQKLPGSRIWFSNPTWANHPSVFAAADRDVSSYAYVNEAGTGLDIDSMCADLEKIPSGDAVVLHGCCHNPTGIDPSPGQWQRIATIIHQRGLLPLVDFAYQGLGSGVDEDATGLRELLRTNRSALICSSYSKNFGLYSERVGALTIVTENRDAAKAALSHAKISVRTNYSNPPRHGAAIVARVLTDDSLRACWLKELAEMRDRINSMRSLFVEKMKLVAPDHDFSFIANQNGMFSYSRLTPVQVDELRHKHAVYAVVSGGRINVAGMTEANIERLCETIAAVL